MLRKPLLHLAAAALLLLAIDLTGCGPTEVGDKSASAGAAGSVGVTVSAFPSCQFAGYTYSASLNKCAAVFHPNVNNSDGGSSLSSEGSGKKAGMRCAIFHEPGNWTCGATSCAQNGSIKTWTATACVTLASNLPGTPWNRRCQVQPNYTALGDNTAFNGYWMYYKDNEITAGYAPKSGSTPNTNWTRACNYTYPNQNGAFGTGAFFSVLPPGP